MSGDLLGNKYRLGELIARGGMAEIYHAQTVGPSGFARESVIKVILPDLVEDQEFREMFKDEAKLAARLNHPNIVQISDFDFDEVRQTFYIVMEHVYGSDFAKLIRAAAERSKRLPPEVVVFVVSEVLEGLRYAHDFKDEEGHPLGIIHRDISPANVLVSYAGAVKLADFGIAKAATSMVRTSAGILKGKYPYMSPEQAAGRPMDRRSDIFSVGIVFYQGLTGRRPFRGKDSVELLERVMAGEYLPARSINPAITPELDAIIVKALHVDLDARYQDAGTFLGDLRLALPRPPTRDDLEECLRHYIPERPRTLSGPNPGGAALAPTVKAPSTVGAGPGVVGDDDPTTRDSLPAGATVAGGRSRRGVVAAIVGGASVAVIALAAVLWVVLGGPGLPGLGRPDAAAGAGPNLRTFTVLVRRSPDQEQELRQHGLDAALAKRGLKLRLLSYQQYGDLFSTLKGSHVDLASVPLAAAKALARENLVVPAGRVAGDGLAAMRARFTAPALEVATVDTALGSDMAFVPELLEVHLLAYRISKVQLARRVWRDHRAEIEAALREANGRGLPAGYDLEEDPAEWDEFDVFVVGWCWARSDAPGVVPAPRLAVRSESYWPTVEALLDAAARHGENRPSWSRRGPLLDVLAWLCLHREHGLQREEVWDPSPAARANGTSIGQWFARGELYMVRVNQFRVSELATMLDSSRAGFDLSDVGFAPMPAGVSVDLDEGGAPVRQGRHDGLVNAWLWAIPESATRRSTSLEVALELSDPSIQLYFAGRNCWIPTVGGVDVASAGSPAPPHCRGAIAPGTERLSRRLLYVSLPEETRLTEIVSQLESLWDELLVERGYRDAETGQLALDRVASVAARHIPEH